MHVVKRGESEIVEMSSKRFEIQFYRTFVRFISLIVVFSV